MIQNLWKMFKKTLECVSARNEYLSARDKILKHKNKGEKGEVMAMQDIFHFNQTKQYDKLVDWFGDEASDGIHLLDMGTGDVITDINTLSKAKGTLKADCSIKMLKNDYVYNSSIKTTSKKCAKYAIINHTPRTAKVFTPTGILYHCVGSLDIIVKEYLDKRETRIITEDVSIDKLESLASQSVKSDFMEVLSYFAFEGSGKGYSKCKANAILYYENGDDSENGEIVFTKCRDIEEKNEHIQSIYDNVIISLRPKGLTEKNKEDEYCRPWLFIDNMDDGTTKYKGSLHIRIKC